MPLNPPVYLDYAASTPIHPEAREAMLACASDGFGNPSSPHSFGRRSRAAVDLARDQVAALLRCDPGEICFTSGGTEANNLALAGGSALAPPGRRKVVISAVEHHSVLNAAIALRNRGFEPVLLAVDRDGALDLDRAAELIDDGTALVSIMVANNETGVIFPVKKLARVARKAGALVHTDAVQAAGLLPLVPTDLGVDMLSLSAHKFYGPQGAGALWVRRGVRLGPLLHGGAQERERRAGTEGVPSLAGLGKAAEIVLRERDSWAETVGHARGVFQEEMAALDGCSLRCSGQKLLPSILNYGIEGVDAELLVMKMDGLGVAIGTGAACASGSTEPSHVLSAMGFTPEEVRSSTRVSFGNGLDVERCRAAARAICGAVRDLRALQSGPKRAAAAID